MYQLKAAFYIIFLILYFREVLFLPNYVLHHNFFFNVIIKSI